MVNCILGLQFIQTRELLFPSAQTRRKYTSKNNNFLFPYGSIVSDKNTVVFRPEVYFCTYRKRSSQLRNVDKAYFSFFYQSSSHSGTLSSSTSCDGDPIEALQSSERASKYCVTREVISGGTGKVWFRILSQSISLNQE